MRLSGGDISSIDLINNLVPVTLGDVLGGSVYVALIYWLVYLRD